MCQEVSSATASVPGNPVADVPDGASEDPDTTSLHLYELRGAQDLVSTDLVEEMSQESPVAAISTQKSLVAVVDDVQDIKDVFYFHPNSIASWLGFYRVYKDSWIDGYSSRCSEKV
jgi:hypothetical protein